MQVEEIDGKTAPEALLRAVHDARVEAVADHYPGEPPLPFEQQLGYFRHPGSGVRYLWAARDGDRVVGSASLGVFGPRFAWIEVTVRPAARRRGIATALLVELVATARRDGVASAFGHHATPAGAAFAASAGARDDQRDVRSRLTLQTADLPEPVLPDGVELRSWIGATPDELLETHAAARAAMSDAPLPGGTEDPGWSVERQREAEAAAIARERPPRVTVALEAGGVVAFTDVRVSAPPSPVALTDDTATVPTARRRGLATAVKREALRRLRAERPDVEFVVTMNAELNTAMRAVNTKLGFEPVTVLTTSVLEL
ncbi:MAG TPA: GNAT family N-acetyltransferase [Candidatus Binatia bacterium]